MPIAETLQPEAGDDRNKQVEIDRVHEIYNLESAPEPSPGEIKMRQVNLMGAFSVSRVNPTIQRF